MTSAALFPLGDFMQYSLHNAVDDLLVNSDLSEASYSHEWDQPTRFINLILFAVIKLFLTTLAINLPIPCGVFTPLFAVGAAMGRFFGEVILAFGFESLTPGGYALVGAASFTAGATGTVSVAVIVFELTNQLSYMLPVLLSVLIGQASARQISLSIYDSLAKTKNLPTFPHMQRQSSYSLPLHKLPLSHAACVPRFTSRIGIEKALLRADNYRLDPQYLFAIVEDLDKRHYVGSISWSGLHLLLQNKALWEKGPVSALGDVEIDLVANTQIDHSTLGLPYYTSLNDTLNYFDIHKRTAFFVVHRRAVIGKLVLREISKLCDEGNL
mmetsp:Transcript_22672/g.40183  ORF Transcript_22672/g.40183 Transcript_22672/m.40183 type:complete len:326 (-) Transcript_22672:348-1325(-)